GVRERPWIRMLYPRRGLALRRRLATASYVWTGCRVARIRLRAARMPRTTEEPYGNEGHWRPATDHQADRGDRGHGPGDWRGGQGTPGEAQRRRGGDSRRDR